MGIQTYPRYHSSFTDHSNPAWDLKALLGIINPDRGRMTCVGDAPSQGRRCRNPIAGRNEIYVTQMLGNLAKTPLESESILPVLKEIIALSLCWRHPGQVDKVAKQWLPIISGMKSSLNQGSSYHYYEAADNCNYTTYDSRPKATRSSTRQSWSYTYYTPEAEPRTSTSSYRQPKQEETEESVKEALRRARERRRREAEEAERERQKQREAEEEEAAERERQEREEAEAEAAAKRKLQEEQEEKARQQQQKAEEAQRKREERQRAAEAKAAQERKEWDQSWETYVKAWTDFKENKQTKTPDSIVWPVKSGRRIDVTELNVKVFFQKAPPKADVPSAMFKLMSLENIKWHPDKISLVFGGERLEDVALIGRIVIQLRATAQRERNEDREEQTK